MMKRVCRHICCVIIWGLLLSLMPGQIVFGAEETSCIVKLREPVEELSGIHVISEEHSLYWISDRALIETLEAVGLVEYVEESCTVTLCGETNDTYYSEQWNILSLGMEAVWERGLTGSGVTVAIVDSGLNVDHEEFEDVNILPGYNAMDKSRNVTDSNGHGSFVAGIIASGHNNGKGIAGLADGVTIAPIKCFSWMEETDIRFVLRAIYAAVDEYHSDVINLSLGMEEDLRSVREAISYAVNSGAIVISAVGNEGGAALMYPAAYDNVIGVGSVGRSGKLSDYSERNNSVFVTAPGENIISITYDEINGYKYGSGTSFSAPHVTALAALARSIDPDLDAAEFKELLRLTSQDHGAPGYDTGYGWGVIRPVELLTMLSSMDSEVPESPDENEEPEEPTDEDVFTDIAGHWARESIRFCTELGLFSGVSDTEFAPELSMSRAMLVTVLWRLEGNPQTEPAGFTDVSDPSSWYYEAVNWAAQAGIVSGFENNEFRPMENLTREQMAVMLWRYLGASGEIDEQELLSSFKDADGISSWAREAVAWCYAKGLMSGMSSDLFGPSSEATRAQVATILYRIICMPRV
ncbi:MAG: S8 family serine peptidase [Eubacteriales bacterium]|nr:S8 family serine peptidase [Eubacteriales bacterium]